MSSYFTYHVVDFLLPAQKFNIQFLYVSQKRLPFIKEFVLRMVNIAPLTKSQIAVFFGMSKLEVDVAISDLVANDELTISEKDALILTNKSQSYFLNSSDATEAPLSPTIEEKSANICFELATFSYFEEQKMQDYWRMGIKLNVDNNSVANSEKIVEKKFQSVFYQLVDNNYFNNQEKTPNLYGINKVSKIKDLSMRLPLEFKMDTNGKQVVREDFKELNDSETMHERITVALSNYVNKDNCKDILKAMSELEDKYSINIFNENGGGFNPLSIADINKLEDSENIKRKTFLGPIYSEKNKCILNEFLAHIINNRIETKEDLSTNELMWIAPSDPFWGKSNIFIELWSNFMANSQTKGGKILYKPKLYVPVGGSDDKKSIKKWEEEFKKHKNIQGIKEGFLGGNVEVIYLENELVVVIYHVSIPDFLPITIPVGFISINKDVVKKVGEKVQKYTKGLASYNNPNDCGKIL